MTCTTEENYLRATTSSNLRVEADVIGSADVLIAAGWSASRIGSALMRLHTKPDTAALALVHEQASMQAVRFKIDRPDVVASAVIAWWLTRQCKVCHGLKFELIPGTPTLSDKACPACKGTGEARLPHGEAGRKMAGWMDECKASAVDGIKRRLRPEII